MQKILIFIYFQGRRTSERFIKPPVPLLGLNTSAPNVLSTGGLQFNSQNNNNSNSGGNNTGSNVSLSSSLNNSLSSSQSTSSNTLPSQSTSSNIPTFAQPASPMETESTFKD